MSASEKLRALFAAEDAESCECHGGQQPDGSYHSEAGLGHLPCGCYYDSGIYRIECARHSLPAAELIAVVEAAGEVVAASEAASPEKWALELALDALNAELTE